MNKNLTLADLKKLKFSDSLIQILLQNGTKLRFGTSK